MSISYKAKKRFYYVALMVLYSILMFVVSDLIELNPLDGSELDELED